MANPCVISKPVQNPAEHVFSNMNFAVVDAYADEMRASGRKVRVTSAFNGKKRVNGVWIKMYIHRAHVY